ncbi:hypothetical protein ACLB2K_054112 [Fragaria x ananassa]
MQLILQRLPLLDYLNCRDVSRCWRAAIDSKRWLPAAHHRLPRLVTSSTLGRCMQASYIKTDDDDDDLRIVCNPNIWNPDAPYCYCAESIEGWLIITFVKFFFWNPVSGARVKLPSRRMSILPPGKVVASSVPTSTTTKCYVSCLHFKQGCCLAFCTPSDKTWTVIEKGQKFWDIEILDGKLYAVGSHALEFVMVFDIHLDTHTYTSQRLVTLHPNIKNIYVDDETLYQTFYLAKCCESKDLFMVLYQNQSNGFEGLFRVLKLEYNNVTTSHQWVEIADLGDRALFIGTLNNIFITCHDTTLEKNCIYFVLSHGQGNRYTSGVFSLTDRSFKPMSLPEVHWRLFMMNQSTWFTPIPC